MATSAAGFSDGAVIDRRGLLSRGLPIVEVCRVVGRHALELLSPNQHADSAERVRT